MIKAAQTDKLLKNSILDLLIFCAEYDISLDETEILQHLPVRASSVGVNSHLRDLVSRNKIVKLKDGSYGTKGAKLASSRRLQNIYTTKPLPAKTRRIVRIAKLVPFIKAVVISSDNILKPTASSQTEPKLIIVTLPNRIYLAKDIIKTLVYRHRDNQDKEKAHKITLNNSCQDIYYSTAGLRFGDKIGRTQYDKVLWFAWAKPLYGNPTWQTLLHNDEFIARYLPNYPYQYSGGKIAVSTSRWLDSLDNARYRDYLQEMSKLKDFKDSSHFLRIRPDVFIAKEHR